MQKCIDEWDDSDAADYCTATVGRVGASTDGTAGHCIVSASCSVTVDVDDVSTVLSKVIVKTVPRKKTDDQTLCVGPNAWGTAYDLFLRRSCESDEVSAYTAVQNGLAAITSGQGDVSPAADAAQ